MAEILLSLGVCQELRFSCAHSRSLRTLGATPPGGFIFFF